MPWGHRVRLRYLIGRNPGIKLRSPTETWPPIISFGPSQDPYPSLVECCHPAKPRSQQKPHSGIPARPSDQPVQRKKPLVTPEPQEGRKKDDFHPNHLYYDGGGRVVRRCWVNFQCQGVLLTWLTVGQGPIVLSVGAGGGCLDIFSLIYHFSFLSPSLWETARYRLKYCLKGPLSPKQPTNQLYYEQLHQHMSGSRGISVLHDLWLYV